MKDSRQKKWFICFGAVLLLFTVYILLDTFVISRGFGSDARQIDYGMFENTSAPGDDAAASAEGMHIASYSDENVSIELTQYRRLDTDIYAADVKLSSARYLMSAFAKDKAGRNFKETTSSIAAAHDAVFAVNGDFYGARERGYVLRNGVIHRDSPDGADVLCIFADGSMQIFSDRGCSVQQLKDTGAWQVFSFGPALVNGGEITVGETDEVAICLESNPRTAVGILDNGHFVFVVSDGRTDRSAGLSLFELAHFFRDELGIGTAYNLDGGGSSTMYFCGRVINHPVNDGNDEERKVSDIVYIP